VNADQYRCVHAACLTMAEQSDSLAARARWLTLAKDCQGLAKDLRPNVALKSSPGTFAASSRRSQLAW
jgi:hypothetical protein